ncbi:hypothetical protein SAMN05444955_11339 [Lihuaxuella thermophila]|uniref:Uncharacterized protein n=1 Tax=Lihuaxuella thermophila TaxID=1173111 RepID=A0A1H8H4J2_9BACL|nr:hypothetical protein SAMN05444955_11339 [Lihuaxuella thermophila]
MHEPKHPREATENEFFFTEEESISAPTDPDDDCLDIRIPAHEVNELPD